jgi:hypothetical protein
MTAWKAQEKYTAIIKLIKELDDYWDHKFGGCRLTKMFPRILYSIRNVTISSSTPQKVTDNFPLVMKAYEKAIGKAKGDSNRRAETGSDVVNYLSYQHGVDGLVCDDVCARIRE